MTELALPPRPDRSPRDRIVGRNRALVQETSFGAQQYQRWPVNQAGFREEAQWRRRPTLAVRERELFRLEIAKPIPYSYPNTGDTPRPPRATRRRVPHDESSVADHRKYSAGKACLDIPRTPRCPKGSPGKQNDRWLSSRWIWPAVAVGLHDRYARAVGGAEFDAQHG